MKSSFLASTILGLHGVRTRRINVFTVPSGFSSFTIPLMTGNFSSFESFGMLIDGNSSKPSEVSVFWGSFSTVIAELKNSGSWVCSSRTVKFCKHSSAVFTFCWNLSAISRSFSHSAHIWSGQKLHRRIWKRKEGQIKSCANNNFIKPIFSKLFDNYLSLKNFMSRLLFIFKKLQVQKKKPWSKNSWGFLFLKESLVL